MHQATHRVNNHVQLTRQGMTRRNLLAALGLAPAMAAEADVWFPDDEIENQLSTYPCAPDTGDTVYRDKYFPLQPNPVSIPNGPAPVQLARENVTRTQMFIVNVDVVPLLIGFGFPPTTTVYSVPLAACGGANDGTGGIIVDSLFKGAIWAIVAANQIQNGTVLFNEIFEPEGARK